MPAPSLVLFDMDNVLCTYSKQVRSAYLAQLTGARPQAR